MTISRETMLQAITEINQDERLLRLLLLYRDPDAFEAAETLANLPPEYQRALLSSPAVLNSNLVLSENDNDREP